MANMYPVREDLSDLPYSEIVVYEALEKLGQNFYVFHSVQWLKKTNRWAGTWKENDFLILNKSLGALVLEVKGGDIEYRDAVFHQINTQTNETYLLDPRKKKDPLSQAIDGAYHYRSVLEGICGASKTKLALDDRFPVEVAVWFPSCEISEKKINEFPLAYREVKEAILDLNSLSRSPQSIYEVFDFYGSRNKVDITDDEFTDIVNSIASDFDLISAPAVKKNELDHAFLKLTQEQSGLLDYLSEQKTATIQGVAGTGKTLIAKQAANNFGAEGHKVLFLCFNKFLYSYLKKQYPYKNVFYYNISSFIHDYSHSNADQSDSETRARLLESIDFDSFDFDDVIIDEAQDFNDIEIEYFKMYSELKGGRFFVFYDKNQVVQTEKLPSWIEKSECRLLLTKNCRNTYEIALTAYNVIDVELTQKIRMINGPKTSLIFAKNDPMSKLVMLIRTLIEEKGYVLNDIVILTLQSEYNSIISNIHRISGIPISNERTNSSIFFTSARKFKGLESRVVIVVDIGESSFSDEVQKRNFYVACSRATQYLALFVIGDSDRLNRIAASIAGPNFAAKGKIAMKTQSEILELS